MHKTALLKELRDSLSKDSIFFVQIGASDGDANDIAKNIIREKDEGIFIEPCLSSFNKLVSNKKNFSNCLFLNAAILPEDIGYELEINILSDDELEQGSSLITELPSSYRKIKTQLVKTLSLKAFIETYNITNIDMFFCDTEGLDHILVQKLLTIIKPKILIFESFFWLDEEKETTLSNNLKITIPSRQTIKEILSKNQYKYIDFNDNIIDKSEDIIAWQNKDQ
jgi:FkbM family methyltransferase